MQVETFECTETAAEPTEASEEAINLIRELGLDGQQSLICKSTKTERDTRSPYREMTAEEKFVYENLCPSSMPIGRYNLSPIPLRVLQVASHAKSLEFFRDILVWDRVSVTVKDPVLVGVTGANEYDSSRKYYILARWGEELETFAVLRKRVCESVRDEMASMYRAAAEKVASATDVAIIQKGKSEWAWCH